MPTVIEITVPLADLNRGRMIACEAAGREILVCRTKDGVFAMDNICSHAYARLSEGRLRGSRAICPLHGAAFDVRSGTAIGGPATLPLAAYAVCLDGAYAKITIPEEKTQGVPTPHAIE